MYEQWENVRTTLQVGAEAGEEGAWGARAEILPQSMMKTMVKHLYSCSPWRTTGEQMWTGLRDWVLEDSMQEQVDARRKLWLHGKPMLEHVPGRSCALMAREAHPGSALLAGHATLQGRVPHWSSLLQRDCPMGGSHTAVAFEERQPVARTNTGEIHDGLSAVGGFLLWSRGKCEEEKETEKMWWTGHNPHSLSPSG